MSIYYKYTPDGTPINFLSNVDGYFYWYTFEAFGKWFVENLGKRFHVNFLGYAHWFMTIRISLMKCHSISVDQSRYATSIVEKYLDTATVKASKKFYKTTLSSDMIFTKDDTPTSDEQVEKLTRGFNIQYKDCIGSLIYLLSKRVDLSFAVHKLVNFSKNPVKVRFKVFVHILRYIMENNTLV